MKKHVVYAWGVAIVCFVVLMIVTPAIPQSEEYGVFEGLESLVDVGGGTGAVAKAISSAFPNLECTVFDLPHVVDDLKKRNTKHLQFVGGDMFEAIPPANAILLKWILHNALLKSATPESTPGSNDLVGLALGNALRLCSRWCSWVVASIACLAD